jgi:hypothetical protein
MRDKNPESYKTYLLDYENVKNLKDDNLNNFLIDFNDDYENLKSVSYCHGQRHPRCSAPLPILSEEGNTLVLYFRTYLLESCIKHARYYKVQS